MTNSATTLDVGLNGVRVAAELRTIGASSTASPDLYVRVSGIKGIESLLGAPVLGVSLGSLDNQWAKIDHTLLDLPAAKGTSILTQPNTEDFMAAATAFGDVNREYLFTTNQDKAVLVTPQKIGTETIDGRETYHYKVTVNRSHLQAYLDALHAAMQKTKYAALTSGQVDALRDLVADAQTINPLDVWVDTDTRTIRSIRIYESADNSQRYVDVGMRYTGGDKYPFTLRTHTDAGLEYNATVTLDTKANALQLDAGFARAGGGAFTGEFHATAKSSNEAVKVTAPADAKPLLDLLGSSVLGASVLNDALLSQSAAAIPTELQALISR